MLKDVLDGKSSLNLTHTVLCLGVLQLKLIYSFSFHYFLIKKWERFSGK
jgi:hypothetical protein